MIARLTGTLVSAQFKQVVLVEDAQRGLVMGFLTREFQVVDRAGVSRAVAAVYVPTNHLYLGDVFIHPIERLQFPDLSVEDGIRIFLTGGMALPGRVTSDRARPRTQ